MKNAFWKDTVRYIRKSGSRFFGAFAIVALGVFAFAGLGSAGLLMQNIGDAYFDDQNFMDIQVISTYGINGGDLDFLMEIEGVAMVAGGYPMDALAYADTEWATVKVDSIKLDNELRGQINMPRLISGRYPEKGNEVLVEPALLSILGLGVGDNLCLESGKNADIRNSLRTDTFRIVGTIQSPLYFSSQRGSSTVGSTTADAAFIRKDENALVNNTGLNNALILGQTMLLAANASYISIGETTGYQYGTVTLTNGTLNIGGQSFSDLYYTSGVPEAGDSGGLMYILDNRNYTYQTGIVLGKYAGPIGTSRGIYTKMPNALRALNATLY